MGYWKTAKTDLNFGQNGIFSLGEDIGGCDADMSLSPVPVLASPLSEHGPAVVAWNEGEPRRSCGRSLAWLLAEGGEWPRLLRRAAPLGRGGAGHEDRMPDPCICRVECLGGQQTPAGGCVQREFGQKHEESLG